MGHGDRDDGQGHRIFLVLPSPGPGEHPIGSPEQDARARFDAMGRAAIATAVSEALTRETLAKAGAFALGSAAWWRPSARAIDRALWTMPEVALILGVMYTGGDLAAKIVGALSAEFSAITGVHDIRTAEGVEFGSTVLVDRGTCDIVATALSAALTPPDQRQVSPDVKPDIDSVIWWTTGYLGDLESLTPTQRLAAIASFLRGDVKTALSEARRSHPETPPAALLKTVAPCSYEGVLKRQAEPGAPTLFQPMQGEKQRTDRGICPAMGLALTFAKAVGDVIMERADDLIAAAANPQTFVETVGTLVSVRGEGSSRLLRVHSPEGRFGAGAIVDFGSAETAATVAPGQTVQVTVDPSTLGACRIMVNGNPVQVTFTHQFRRNPNTAPLGYMPTRYLDLPSVQRPLEAGASASPSVDGNRALA